MATITANSRHRANENYNDILRGPNILSEAAGSMALINVLSSSGFTLESIQRKEYGLTNSDLAIYVLYFGDADGNYNSK